jgi:hypothetical protein
MHSPVQSPGVAATCRIFLRSSLKPRSSCRTSFWCWNRSCAIRDCSTASVTWGVISLCSAWPLVAVVEDVVTVVDEAVPVFA